MSEYGVGIVSSQQSSATDLFPSNIHFSGTEREKNCLRVFNELCSANSFGVIEDYDNFVRKELVEILGQIRAEVDESHVAMITDITILQPQHLQHKTNMPIYPADARAKKLTYASEVYGYVTKYRKEDISIAAKNGTVPTPISQSISPSRIMSIPVMTGSSICRLHGMSDMEKRDYGEKIGHPGGTFIVNGHETFIQMLEMCRLNTAFIFDRKANNGGPSCSVTHDLIYTSIVTNIAMQTLNIKQDKNQPSRSVVSTTGYQSKYNKQDADPVEIAVNSETSILGNLDIMVCTNGVSRVTDEEKYHRSSANVISLLISISEIFGIVNPQSGTTYDVMAIVNFIYMRCNSHNWSKIFPVISPTIDYALTIDDHVEHVSTSLSNSSTHNSLESFIDVNILLLTSGNNHGKMETLVNMIIYYSEFLAGLRSISNRDAWSNKRLSTASKTFGKKIRSTIYRNLSRPVFNSTFDSLNQQFVSCLTNSLFSLLGSNNRNKSSGDKNNEVQAYMIYNPVSMKGQQSRVSVSVNTKSQITEVRKVKDQQGYIDPINVPQSGMCGINKELSVLCKVTHAVPADCIIMVASRSENVRSYVLPQKLVINDVSYGTCNGDSVRREIDRAISSGDLDSRTLVTADSSIVKIYTPDYKEQEEQKNNVLDALGDKDDAMSSQRNPHGVFSHKLFVNDLLYGTCNPAVAEAVIARAIDRGVVSNDIVFDVVDNTVVIYTANHDIQSQQMIEFLSHGNMILLYNDTHSNMLSHKLFINELAYGTCDGNLVRQEMIEARRMGIIPRYSEIIIDSNNLRIHTDAGRLVTPFFVVNPDTQRLVIDEQGSWDDSPNFSNGTMEYIGTHEQYFWRIAREYRDIQDRLDKISRLKRFVEENESHAAKVNEVRLARQEIEYEEQYPFTHMFVHPMQMMGPASNTVPLANFTQCTKVTGQANLVKQVTGPVDNSITHFVPTTKFSMITTHPIVSTVYERQLLRRSGVQACVSVHSIDGNAVEDAAVMNQNSVHMFSNCVGHTHRIVLMNSNDVIDSIKKPVIDDARKAFRYRFLADNGLPCIGAPLTEGDYMLGIERKKMNPVAVFNNSRKVSAGEDGVVTDIHVYESSRNKGETIIEILLVKYIPAMKSNKYTFRCGQKYTIAKILPASMLPRSINGCTPDIVVSAFMAKRMTLSLQAEGVLSAIGALDGRLIDGTPWNVSYDDIMQFVNRLKSIDCECESRATYRGRPIRNKICFALYYTQATKYLALTVPKAT